MRLLACAVALVVFLTGAAYRADASPDQQPVPSPDGLFRAGNTFDPDKHPGKALFAGHCATCHEGGFNKAPHRQFLETMAPDAIVTALTSGVMKQQGAALTADQRRAVAEYLTRTDLTHYKPEPGATFCAAADAGLDLAKPPAQIGWGYDPRRFVPADVAGLDTQSVARLKLKWAFAFPAALRARSQPVIAMGAVFVGSQDGTVYAFDLDKGCAKWTTRVSAEVRTAIVIEPWPKGKTPSHDPKLFFGDLLGRVYAANAVTGKILWQVKPIEHPNATITGTPALHGDTLFVPVSSLENVAAADPAYACCTFRGAVVALDVETGRVKWEHDTIPQPPAPQGKTSVGTAILGPSGASVWNNPTVDTRRGVIYFGSGQNYSWPTDGNSDAVFAVDMATGQRRWTRQLSPDDSWNPACAMKGPNCAKAHPLDHDVASSPLLIDLANGRQILVAGQKSGMAYGLDPDTGKLIWQRRLGRGSVQGGIHFGMAAEGNRLYVPILDSRFQGDGTSSPDPGLPGLVAIDAATGKILWRAADPNGCGNRPYCDAGMSAAPTALPGMVLAGDLAGILRAYDGTTGKILWQADTSRSVKAVNGVMTRGGSISGPGPAVAAGHVIINSGYGYAMHMPGNAFLVYTVDGK